LGKYSELKTYMAQTNHERFGTALEVFNGGLTPFIERQLERVHGGSVEGYRPASPRRWRAGAGQERWPTRVGHGGAPETDVGMLERSLCRDARPGATSAACCAGSVRFPRPPATSATASTPSANPESGPRTPSATTPWSSPGPTSPVRSTTKKPPARRKRN